MLSTQSVNVVRDILECRISAMDITDREDKREAALMIRALNEIKRLGGLAVEATDFSDMLPRRGRKRKLMTA